VCVDVFEPPVPGLLDLLTGMDPSSSVNVAR
jgi:hypothetical protein